MYIVKLAFANLDQKVEDEAGGDPVRDAVAEGHKNTGKESGNRLFQLAPFNLLKGGEHQNTDHNQRGCRCRCRDKTATGARKCYQ